MNNEFDNKTGGSFSYAYSASEQNEIKRIRDKYSVKTTSEDPLLRLRRLDSYPSRIATIIGLCFGVIGALVFGFGLSLILTELYLLLSLTEVGAFALGCALGTLGGALIALGYPAYLFSFARARARVGEEILRLTDELLK